jgi:cell wall-associated NlpC family hydrolase
VRRLALGACALVVCFGLGLGALAAAVAAAAGGGGLTATATSRATASTAAAVGPAPGPLGGTRAVPPAWEAIERAAAATCHGLAWSLLGAIGRVESDSGRSTLPGVAAGANAYGAEGPMQFEASTFAEYAVVGPGGATPPSPYDPVDAVYTAAHLLCADDAGSPNGMYDAVWDYDHTRVYVGTVLVLSHALEVDPGLGSAPASAIAFAASKLGVPYVWGGTGPDGYDCSGLVQAAYRAAGVALPRVAQTQFDAGPRLPPFTPPVPGDLVFFGTSAGEVSHVGIYIGAGEIVDAPHTGTVVRVETTPTVPGARWGDEVLVGETRPWAA